MQFTTYKMQNAGKSRFGSIASHILINSTTWMTWLPFNTSGQLDQPHNSEHKKKIEGFVFTGLPPEVWPCPTWPYPTRPTFQYSPLVWWVWELWTQAQNPAFFLPHYLLTLDQPQPIWTAPAWPVPRNPTHRTFQCSQRVWLVSELWIRVQNPGFFPQHSLPGPDQPQQWWRSVPPLSLWNQIWNVTRRFKAS